MSGLVFPRHLRESERFLNQNRTALVLMPRGHAKTTHLIHRAARLVGKTRGKTRLGVLTNVMADAFSRSRAIKNLVEHPRFAEVFPWAQDGVVGSKWTDEVWTVKGVYHGKDSTCFADGMRSIKPGARLDILLADDVVGMAENQSSYQRQKASETYWQVVDPMVTPGGVKWYLGTRWHEGDFYAELQKKGLPTYVRRAIQEDGTPLWPDVYKLDDLLEKKKQLGTPIFMLQYQNDVTSMGGNIFRGEYIRRIDDLPPGTRRRIGVDLASSTSDRADYTACVEILEDDRHNIYVTGVWRERLDERHRDWLLGVDRSGNQVYPDGPRLLWPANTCPTSKDEEYLSDSPRFYETINIEAVQHQSTFVNELLSDTRLPITGVRPERDKVTRSRALAARYEAGKVFHWTRAPGIEDLEREMMTFPNSDHDDLIDSLVYAADIGTSSFYFTSASTVKRW